MLLRAQELDGGAFLLQRITGVGDALDHNLGRGELEGLWRVGREFDLAGADEGGRDVLMRDLIVVGKGVAVHDNLKVGKAAAVVQGYETEVLHVADGLDPTGNRDGLAAKSLGVGVKLGDLRAFHASSFRRNKQGEVPTLRIAQNQSAHHSSRDAACHWPGLALGVCCCDSTRNAALSYCPHRARRTMRA